MENIKENFTKEEIYIIRNAIFERWSYYSKKIHDTNMIIIERNEEDETTLRFKRKLEHYEEHEKIIEKFYKYISEILFSFPLVGGGEENGK